MKITDEIRENSLKVALAEYFCDYNNDPRLLDQLYDLPDDVNLYDLSDHLSDVTLLCCHENKTLAELIDAIEALQQSILDLIEGL